MHSLIRTAVKSFTGALAFAFLAGTHPAQSGDFYAGKVVSIIVGSTAGGGYDQYSRALARYLNSHIPGTPTIIVKNMPGAGSLTSVLHLNTTAPKDGTAMTAFNSGLFNDSIAEGDKAKAKFTDYAFVGSITRDFRICYTWKGTKVATWGDLLKSKEVVFGATGPNSNSYNGGAMIKNIFDVNMKIISAYPGNSEVFLAVERGEIDGSCISWTSVPDDWIQNKKINILTRLGTATPPEIPASVPFVGDVAKTQEQKDIIDVLLAPGELGRPYIMSKEVPADRLAQLRTSFDATMVDPAFLAEAKKQGLAVDPIGGAQAQEIVARLYTFSPEIVAKATAALK
jgi:tripartite-type tricarboxylate transporter receptor subunit TctC